MAELDNKIKSFRNKPNKPITITLKCKTVIRAIFSCCIPNCVKETKKKQKIHPLLLGNK